MSESAICYNYGLQKQAALNSELIKSKSMIVDLQKQLDILKSRQTYLTQQLLTETNKNSFAKTHLQILKIARKHLV